MKNLLFLLTLCGVFLVSYSQTTPPKKRNPVNKTIKIPIIYKNFNPSTKQKMPINNNIKILIDTSKGKIDTVFVQS